MRMRLDLIDDLLQQLFEFNGHWASQKRHDAGV